MDTFTHGVMIPNIINDEIETKNKTKHKKCKEKTIKVIHKEHKTYPKEMSYSPSFAAFFISICLGCIFALLVIAKEEYKERSIPDGKFKCPGDCKMIFLMAFIFPICSAIFGIFHVLSKATW